MKRMISLLMVAAMLVMPAFAEASWTQNQEIAHEIADLMRSYGYSEDNPIIRAASDWWWAEENAKPSNIAALEPSHESDHEVITYVTQEQRAEYPVASAVWQYLKSDLGLSDVCAAGIIGNMMAECGGQTLDLQPYIYGYGYYGLCMWYLEYTNGRLYWGSSVDEQLIYLGDTLEWAFDYWGYDYQEFCSLTDAYSAAYMFEVVYERGTWSDIRGQNAMEALAYFGN